MKSKGQNLKKVNEYMWWSPFIQHHKPKLQVNVQTGKWHCWVSNQGGHNLFQLLKQVGAPRELYKELSDTLGTTYYSTEKKDDKQVTLNLPKEAKPLWNGGDSVQKLHALKFVYERGLDMSDVIRYNLHYCLNGIYQKKQQFQKIRKPSLTGFLNSKKVGVCRCMSKIGCVLNTMRWKPYKRIFQWAIYG